MPGVARKSEDGLSSKTRNHIVRENITSHSAILTKDLVCVISDIVKRRSIRVGSCEAICASHHNLQIVFGACLHREM